MCSAARSKGITGVPMTIIDGKWAVSGGQSSEVFIQVRKMESLFQNAFKIFTIDLQETCSCWNSLCPVTFCGTRCGDWILCLAGFLEECSG